MKEVFSAETPLGALVLEAFQFRRSIGTHEIESSNGKRVQMGLDFIQEGGAQIGALLTLRDTESVKQIEDEIETSRLSASGRLTRGVAHEVKNPINAIVLHLQLLQNKLNQVDPDTRRHMDIIGSEIQRLDRVVQILVDFTRPRSLRMEETDLRRILEDVALLAAPDAAQHGVALVRQLPNQRLPVKVDIDFLKQAILNIVLNGVQAMPEGGTLTLSGRIEKDAVIAEIRDKEPAFLRKCRRRFLSFISPPNPMAAASGWRKPTRFCNGITGRSNSIPPRAKEPRSGCDFRSPRCARSLLKKPQPALK